VDRCRFVRQVCAMLIWLLLDPNDVSIHRGGIHTQSTWTVNAWLLPPVADNPHSAATSDAAMVTAMHLLCGSHHCLLSLSCASEGTAVTPAIPSIVGNPSRYCNPSPGASVVPPGSSHRTPMDRTTPLPSVIVSWGSCIFFVEPQLIDIANQTPSQPFYLGSSPMKTQ